MSIYTYIQHVNIYTYAELILIRTSTNSLFNQQKGLLKKYLQNQLRQVEIYTFLFQIIICNKSFNQMKDLMCIFNNNMSQ